jgi:peptidoglycan/LPS O-acetylase OafA/YrhL
LQTKPSLEYDYRRHIPALDGIRGVAAGMIFVYHYGGGAQSSFLPLRAIGNLLHFGWIGVSLFFVLSGFLISGILWDGYQKSGWWRRFYVRRSLRIFPLYYLAIAIAAGFWIAVGTPISHLSELWVYVLYLRDVPNLPSGPSMLPTSIELGHFWSLAIEEQFYLFWPFVLALAAGKRLGAKRLILILWLVSLAFRVAMLGLHNPEWGSHFLVGRAGELFAGAYLAMVIRGDALERQRLFRALPYIFGSSLVLLALLSIFSPSYEISSVWWASCGLALLSICFASMIGLALRPGIIQFLFQTSVLRWLGKISYGIYVYHLLFRHGYIWLTDHIAPNASYNGHLALLFAIALASTLIIASLSFYTYESAFLRLKERLAH